MSKPTPEQLQQVTQWVVEGATLSDIQSRLSKDFGISLTYMDVRFLVDDLGVVLVDKPEPKSPEPAENVSAAAPATASDAGNLLSDGAASPTSPASKVSVVVDTLARPGASISGKVTFSDGQSAEWYVDEMGRPGLVPTTPGYRPTNDDIRAFQTLLDAEFRKLGY